VGLKKSVAGARYRSLPYGPKKTQATNCILKAFKGSNFEAHLLRGLKKALEGIKGTKVKTLMHGLPSFSEG
jgi:hypothetical protein